MHDNEYRENIVEALWGKLQWLHIHLNLREQTVCDAATYHPIKRIEALDGELGIFLAAINQVIEDKAASPYASPDK